MQATGLVQKLRAHTSFVRTPESARKFRQLLSSSPLSKSPSADEGLNRSSYPSSSAYQLSESFSKEPPMSSSLTLHSVGLVAQVTEFALQYAGSVRLPSLQMPGKNIDCLLEKLRQTQQINQELAGRERGGGGGGGEETDKGSCTSSPSGFGASLLVNKSYSSMDALAGIDGSRMIACDKSVLDLLEDGSESAGGSSAGRPLKEERGRKEEGDESDLVATEKREDNSQDAGAPHPPLQALPTISVTPNSPTDSGAPATLPLTEQHKQDEAVSSVTPSTVSGDQPSLSGEIRYRSVQLAISTQHVCVTSPVCGKMVLEKTITSIAFCMQVGLCVCACVHAYVRACVCVYMCVCVHKYMYCSILIGIRGSWNVVPVFLCILSSLAFAAGKEPCGPPRLCYQGDGGGRKGATVLLPHFQGQEQSDGLSSLHTSAHTISCSPCTGCLHIVCSQGSIVARR